MITKSLGFIYLAFIFSFTLFISACNQVASTKKTMLEDSLITASGELPFRGSVMKQEETLLKALNFDKSNMVQIPAGSFKSASDNLLDTKPIHEVPVEGFWLDEHEVTNADFALFVEATGYQTIAERALDPVDFPTVPLDMLVPGSFVISPKTDIRKYDHKQEEIFVAGANWRHPEGPSSTIKGKENSAVVQVSYEDAEAYAKWMGKRLPTQMELEYAAQGGYFLYNDLLHEYHHSGSGRKDKMERASNKMGFRCVGDTME